MSLARRLGRGSFIYLIATILPRGLAFFLLPLYTRLLSPEDYGTLTVVTALTGVLVILFTLSTHSAVTRYYFDYRDDPATWRRFSGSILTFMFLLSAIAGTLLLLFGEPLLRPVLGDIPFLPFAALGIGAAMFQPFFQTLLAVLQVQEQPGRYAFFSVLQFLVNLGLILLLVVGLGWHAEGPLSAALVTAVVFFALALYALRRDFAIALDRSALSKSLSYSMPIIPHALAGQIQAITDKLLLNNLIGTASAGIYNVGYLFGSVMMIVTESVNRAYVPVAMSALRGNVQAELGDLQRVGLMVLAGYALLALLLSLFAPEIIALLTTRSFHDGHVVVHYIAFGGVANGVYLLLVNVLFFAPSATRLIPMCTLVGAGSNVALNLLLIPHWGMSGAAVAALASQTLTAIFIGWIARRYEPLPWDYARMAGVIGVCFAVAVILANSAFDGWFVAVSVKLAAFVVSVVAVGLIAWGEPWHLPRVALRSLHRAMGRR